MSANSRHIRILAVDDHPLLREGIGVLIRAEPDMCLVAEASNGLDAIEQFRIHRPGITLMDLQMPDLNGIEVIERIVHQDANARIVVLTTYTGDVRALRAFQAGARAYVLKGNAHHQLLEAIRAVQAGRKWIAPEIAAGLAEHATDKPVSGREVEVLRLMASGDPNKRIADRLAISDATVKVHVSRILAKLGANDRTHAVTIAMRRGIIELLSRRPHPCPPSRSSPTCADVTMEPSPLRATRFH